MSMRHLFGFDHIPLGAVDPALYYDTRLKFFVGEGSTQAGTIVDGQWISAGGGTAFQALTVQVYQDTPSHVVFGFRARQGNIPTGTAWQPPLIVYLSGAFNVMLTAAEYAANRSGGPNGDYYSFDFNFTSGVIRRWINKTELPTITLPVATLKAATYVLPIQAYQNTYQQYQYRDMYVGDNFDGVDVNVLGDRLVRSLPVKAASGSKWTPVDPTALKTALNKAWVTGATDVTASNVADNSALRVQFDVGSLATDVDAIQVEFAGSVASPTVSMKAAREGDAVGKVTALSPAIKWGGRSPVYQTKADGSKITAADIASMNFDISGV